TVETAANTNLYDNSTSELSAENVQDALDEIQSNLNAANAELATIDLVDKADGLVTLVKADGSSATVAKSNITDNGNGTYTFTNNDGTDVIIDANTLNVAEANGVY